MDSDSSNDSIISVQSSVHSPAEIIPIEPPELKSNSPVARNHPKKYNNVSAYEKNILIKFYEDGKTVAESAAIAGINKNTAKAIIKNYKKNGGVLIEKSRGGQRNLKLSTDIVNEIEKVVGENPSITLRQIREKILESKNINLSLASINNGLKKKMITLQRAKRRRSKLIKDMDHYLTIELSS